MSRFSNFFFNQKIEPDPFRGFGSNLESPVMIFLCGSKFQSVNTKTSQFSQFFDLHEFEKNMSTPKVWEKKHVNTKTRQFSPFFWLARVWEKHVNTKTSQVSPFFGFQEFGKQMSTTKLSSQFSPFFGIPGVWEKHVNTKTSQVSPFFEFQELRKKHVNTKASQFSTFFGFQEFEKKTCQHQNESIFPMVLSFSPSTPKLVNFPHFLDFRNLRKTCQHQN